jgi:hypothetical protein
VKLSVSNPPATSPISDLALDNKFTIASWRILCIPKKRNITKLSSIICCVDGKESRKDATFVEEEDEDMLSSWFLLLDDHTLVELTGDGDEWELCGMSGCVVLSEMSCCALDDDVELPNSISSNDSGAHIICGYRIGYWF